MTARPKLRTWRTKLLVLLLVFAVVPPALLTWWEYVTLRHAWRESTLASLGALAKAKAEGVDQFILDRRSEVERIASLLAPQVATVERSTRRVGPGELPPLADAAVPPAGGEGAGGPPAGDPAAAGAEPAPRPTPPSQALSELRESLTLILWDQRRFEELMVIDAQGRVVASTHEAHEGTSAAEVPYFRAGLGSTHLEPVFVSPITGELTTVLVTPVRDAGRGVVGVLAARLNLERFFLLINDTTGLGASGETVVAKSIGEEMVFMAPTRHDADAALARRSPHRTSEGRPLRQAARGEGGAGGFVDYRGEAVLAGWAPIPSLDWGLVVKMDRHEALSPVTRAAASMLAVLLAVVVLAALAAVATARALVEPLKKLRAATERISRGDLEVDLGIQSRDEIGELAASFERMVAAIKFFRAHSRRPEEDEPEAVDEEATLY